MIWASKEDAAIAMSGKMVIIRRKSKWILKSRDRTKTLGVFRTKKEALERERQIMYFKRKKMIG